MNYSRNIKKTAIGRRILISWFVVAIAFFLIGFGIGFVTSYNKPHVISYENYIVSPGDTLWDIAQKIKPEGMKMENAVKTLKEINSMKNSEIFVGDTIKIPIYKERSSNDD